MNDVKDLPASAMSALAEHGAQGREALRRGNILAAEKHFLAAWGAIPQPQLEYDYAQSLTVALTEFYRDTAQPVKAMQWLALAREAYGPEANPHTEFLAATVSYEAGDFDEAYRLFDQLFKQYNRRPFQEARPEYLSFYLDRAGKAK